MHSVLFVCSMNICRSPMAEGLFRLMIEPEQDEWQIASAGVWAVPGYPIAENTARVLLERGIDLQSHRSRPISAELIAAHKLILTMENGQKEALRYEYPDHSAQVYLLSEMIGRNFEISDPIGGAYVDFTAAANLINEILHKGFERIHKLSRDMGNAS